MRFLAGEFAEAEVLSGLQALGEEAPQWVIDLRTARTQRLVAWAGDELPVYHAGDVLNGLCTWEDATYPTSVENMSAVYPPAVGAELPEELPSLPEDATLVFLDARSVNLVTESEGERLWWGEDAPDGWTPVTADNWTRGGKKQGFWRRLWNRKNQK